MAAAIMADAVSAPDAVTTADVDMLIAAMGPDTVTPVVDSMAEVVDSTAEAADSTAAVADTAGAAADTGKRW